MWLRLDDRLHSHPKVDTLSNAALGLWTRALSWTGDTLSDGFIPNIDMRRRFKATPAQIKALVDAGLWIPTTVDGVDGWKFHDFEKWNEPATKAGVEKRRSKSRESSKNHREKVATQLSIDHFVHTSSAEVNQKRFTSESEVSREFAQNEHDESTKPKVDNESMQYVSDHSGVTLDPTRPDPNIVKGGANVTVVGANEHNGGATAPGMDNRCDRHRHIPLGQPVPPCHACRDTRLENEFLSVGRAHHEAQRRHERQASCSRCDSAGWLLDDFGQTVYPAVRCTHTVDLESV